MTELTSMRNIGREMARKLTAVGIDSPEKLTAAGAKEAFFQMKLLFPQVCLVHLYVLEGAIQNLDYDKLPPETRADLRAFSDSLKNGGRGEWTGKR